MEYLKGGAFGLLVGLVISFLVAVPVAFIAMSPDVTGFVVEPVSGFLASVGIAAFHSWVAGWWDTGAFPGAAAALFVVVAAGLMPLSVLGGLGFALFREDY